MNQQDLVKTLELIKTAQQTAIPDEIAKAFTQSGSPTTGLTNYDLQAPALTIYPNLSPLRNKIPRVSGKGGTQATWKAITGINTGNTSMGLAEGKRSGIISTKVSEYLASYKGLGLEDSVTFEAESAAEGFDDVRGRAVQGLLRSTMIGEENVILGGNTSSALGTTPTPSLATATTGGTIAAAAAYSVICVALGYDAYWAAIGTNNGNTGQAFAVATSVIPGQITRTNADGTSDTYGGGSAQKSANATIATTGSTSTVSATVAPVIGAYGYAWFAGATAGTETLQAVTSINSVVLTSTVAGGQAASLLTAVDSSTNSLLFDGLLTQITKAGSGAYVKTLATGTAGVGVGLTSDGAGGINEIDAAFNAYWQQYRLSPDTIYVNSQELINANKKIIANGGAPIVRFNMDANAMNGNYSAGAVLGSYLNKITNQLVKIEVHPTLPAGTMLFYSSSIPYSLSGVSNVLQIKTRRDYYQIEYPLRTRKYEYGVYMDEVLQNYFPPAFGIITNIANV